MIRLAALLCLVALPCHAQAPGAVPEEWTAHARIYDPIAPVGHQRSLIHVRSGEVRSFRSREACANDAPKILAEMLELVRVGDRAGVVVEEIICRRVGHHIDA